MKYAKAMISVGAAVMMGGAILGISFAPSPAHAASKAQAPTADGDPATWIQESDYPAGGFEGRTKAVLSVDTTGAPTACTLVESSGHEDLDQRACSKLMERAHFHPATNGKGEAVTGIYPQTINWKLGSVTAHFEPENNVMIVDIRADGSVANCTFVTASGEIADKKDEYEAACRSATYNPYLDANGNPVSRRVTVTQSIVIEPVP